MTAEAHNEFVLGAIRQIGPGIAAQSSLSAQLVAVESLLAGMIALVANINNMSLFAAETSIRAVAKGAEDRLRNDLLREKP